MKNKNHFKKKNKKLKKLKSSLKMKDRKFSLMLKNN